MLIFFITFFSFYAISNYYVFSKTYPLLPDNWLIKFFFCIIFGLVVVAYVLSRALNNYLSNFIYEFWLTIGAIWFAFLAYLILTLLIIDILLIFNKLLKFLPTFLFEIKNKRILALMIFSFISTFLFLGNLNKRDIIINELEVEIQKKKSNLDSLTIALASDIHLSPIDGEKLLSKIVDKINSINPDIILLAGDLVDDKSEILIRHQIGKSFSRLKSKYGIFSINGNHEYINGVESSVKYIEKLGIKMVRDTAILIDNNFYIIGREDSVKFRFVGEHRKTLSDLVKELDFYPKILLDHTPFNLNEAIENNIDIQLSGHTHHGQIFPGNLITPLIYEISWGYKKKANTHFYVTSGAGTWGPPVRIGSKSEIVKIKIKFVD
jgi:predicted MPP superfamily phosphohydrolase